MKPHQRINADSGSDEYYSPPDIVEAARRTMGGIDLDPASSRVANERIRATYFFSLPRYDGLRQDWHGRVWLNHPFGRDTNGPWIERLISEYKSGRVKQACCITFASTSEAWFRPLLEYPQCFIHKRTNYFLADGTLKKGVTKGSVVTYLGDNPQKFRDAFAGMGTIKVELST